MEKILRLGGKELRCIDKIPLGIMFDLAESMEEGAGEMKAIAALSRTIRAIVVKEDRPLLQEILNSTDNVATLDDLNNAVGGVLEQYGQRPTLQSLASQHGPGETARTSKVVSLWPATVKKDETSSRDGSSVAS